MRKIAEQRKIPLYFIDKNLEEIINDGHKWYNYLIYLALSLFLFVLIFHSFSLHTKLILTLIFSYFIYFALIATKRGREERWAENIVNILEDKRFKNVLLICGEGHIKFSEIKEDLAGRGYRVLTV